MSQVGQNLDPERYVLLCGMLPTISFPVHDNEILVVTVGPKRIALLNLAGEYLEPSESSLVECELRRSSD